MIKILQKENLGLRLKAEEVPLGDIKSKRIAGIIKTMQKALLEQEDGVAIAAPQIGENLRIFVMSKRVFEMVRKFKEGKEIFRDQIFINPKITKISKEKMDMDEGCLSVRYLYGKVLRSKKATVEAYDQNGKKFTMGGSGIVAQVFQHENDHLEGVLFIDKAKNLEEIPPHSVSTKKTK